MSYVLNKREAFLPNIYQLLVKIIQFSLFPRAASLVVVIVQTWSQIPSLINLEPIDSQTFVQSTPKKSSCSFFWNLLQKIHLSRVLQISSMI